MESCPSGRWCSTRNAVSRKGPRVRIPNSPPRRRKLCIACGDFFVKSHRALTPLRLLFPTKLCCANFRGGPFAWHYVEVYRYSAIFPSGATVLKPTTFFLALPPAFRQFLGQRQGLFHCGGAQLFRLGIQVGVDVRCGGDVAVAQPFLNLLHGHALLQQQAGAGVPKLVEAENE